MSKTENDSIHPLRSLFERMESYERVLDLSSYDDPSANIWPLIKFSIYQSYTLRYLNKNTLFDRIKKRLAKNKKAKSSPPFEKSSAEINKNDLSEIWISYASNRNMFNDKYNKFIDPYFHYLASDSAKMFETGSSNSSHSYPHPIFKDKEIINLDHELNSIKASLSLTKPQKAAIFSFYEVKSKFKLAKLKKIFPELNVYSAVYEYEIFKHNYSVYREFFSKFKNLKKIYLSSYYFADRLGMMAAAEHFGIECIDIQHGVQSSAHYAYSGWEILKIDTFNSMPGGFLVYSEKEKERLQKEMKNPDQIKVVANLSYKYWNEHRKSSMQAFKGEKYLLYTLQNQIPDKEHFIWTLFKEFNNKGVGLLFRLHPGYKDLENELKAMLAQKGISAFTIDDQEDIYDSLNDCLVHITQFSSSTLDALLLNKKTILIDPRGKEYFSELLENEEKVIYIDEQSDLLDCIQHIIGE